MFRLLALVATTLAAPQYPYYPQFAGYPIGPYGYPAVQATYMPGRVQTWGDDIDRRMIYPPAYPTNMLYPSVPVVQAAPPMNADTRQLVKFENFMEINSKFVVQNANAIDAAGATVSQQNKIVGTVNVQQNLLTDFLNGNEAQYKIYVQTTGDLDLTGQNIMLGLADNCAIPATGTEVFATVNAPPQINGFYIAGRTTGFNINGENDMTTLRGKFMQILDATGTMVIGCTEAADRKSVV